MAGNNHGIRQRGKASWQVRVYAGIEDGRRRQVTRTIRGSRRDAERARARLLTELADGKVAPSKVGTVEKLLEDYVETVGTLKNWSPSTYAAVDGALRRYLVPGLGGQRADRLTPAEITTFYAGLRRAGVKGPVSPAYLERIHGILHAAYQWAVDTGRLPSNPAQRARKSLPAVVRPELRPPTAGEVIQLLAAVNEDLPEFAMYLRVAAATGARRGEVCGLQWPDLDLELGEVSIRRRVVIGTRSLGVLDMTKNGKVRRIALDPTTTELLRQHQLRVRERAMAFGTTLARGAFVFTDDPRGTQPWRPDSAVTGRFVRLRDRLGLHHVRLHDLRHANATELLLGGIDPKNAADRLGHDARTMMGTYAHGVKSADRRAADLMGSLLDGTPIR